MLLLIILLFGYIQGNPVNPPNTRDEIGKMLEFEGHKIGVELGVQHGYFANRILQDWKSFEKFYLIDIWMQLDNYVDSANVNNQQQEIIYNTCKLFLNKYDQNKLVYIRNFTTLAVPFITEPLDFIYIDARHDYCGVTDDINLYWPKIKSGGIMAGHDYLNVADVKKMTPHQDWGLCEDGSRNEGAVKGAVNEFAAKHNLVVTFTKESWPTWFIRKP